MGKGPGWASHQRSLEELVKAETRSGPGGEPRRPRTWGLGAAGVLGFLVVLFLALLLGECGGPADEPDVSPTPSHGVVATASR